METMEKTSTRNDGLTKDEIKFLLAEMKNKKPNESDAAAVVRITREVLSYTC